jgi:hypothetical protein
MNVDGMIERPEGLWNQVISGKRLGPLGSVARTCMPE